MAGWKSEHGALAKPPQMGVVAGYTEWASQFLWELHFIEACPATSDRNWLTHARSSFGNCTSLRRQPARD